MGQGRRDGVIFDPEYLVRGRALNSVASEKEVHTGVRQ